MRKGIKGQKASLVMGLVCLGMFAVPRSAELTSFTSTSTSCEELPEEEK